MVQAKALSAASEKPKFRRVLLKLSGDALMGEGSFGLDAQAVSRVSDDIRAVHALDVQVCVVVGAGNIFRGVEAATKHIERTTADYMGMLATVMNALALQGALERHGLQTRVLSAIQMQTVCEPYIRRRALRHLEKGRVVIFAAGTGSPYYTTDTAAALRASEMGCECLMKATKVDGVYDADPMKNPKAKRHDRLTYLDVLSRDLRVMDATAIALARENRIPILVFSMRDPGGFADAVCDRGRHTLIADA